MILPSHPQTLGAGIQLEGWVAAAKRPRPKTIIRDGLVTGVDLPAIRQEMLSQTRSGISENRVFSRHFSLEQAVVQHYFAEPPVAEWRSPSRKYPA
jgi:hypothetical protein